MSIFNKLMLIFSSENSVKQDNYPSTDSFADNLILEFRSTVNDAVLSELDKYQEKYLSNILRQSHFPIVAISIIPADHEIAKSVDEFFRIHSEIDKDFEQNFFTKHLQIEYRTPKGAKAIITKNVSFNIQPSHLGTDTLTGDESYQINLRGNRKKFTALVELGKITADQIVSIKSNIPNTEVKSYEFSNEVKKSNNAMKYDEPKTKITIQINDKDGCRELLVTLPVVLGRESGSEKIPSQQKIIINSTYISRNQFIIFDINQTVYGFVPQEAKLTAVLGRRGTLRPLSLIEIDKNGLQMTFGQPIDSAVNIVNPDNPELYPSITVRLCDNAAHDSMTLVPNVRKQ